MSAPLKPVSFTVAYEPDWYVLKVNITAGDATHTHFKIYINNNGSWEALFSEENSAVNTEIPLGSESDIGKSFRVTTINADGESPYLETVAVAAPPPPITAAPTNLIATRRATANTIPDAQWIDLTWSGTLVDGDQWEIRLIDWMGYGNDTLFTTSANTFAVEIGQWIDREIKIYPVNTPDNKAVLTVPKRPPIRSVPTDLSAKITTTGDLTIQFDSDWFWLATRAKASDNVHPAALIWYGVYDPITETSEPLQSIDPGTIGVLSNNRFALAQPLTALQQGLQYRVTVEIGSDNGGFSSLVMEQKPEPVLALPEGINSTLTAVTLTNHDNDAMVFEGFYPFYLMLTWQFSDPNNPRAIDVETKIDGSEWQYTGSSVDGYAVLEMVLHGNRYSNLDQSGLLDAAHDYVYSDGVNWLVNEVPPLHTIHARARISGNTADTWIEAAETFAVPLRSRYRQQNTWLGENHRNNAEWNSPIVYGETPPGLEKRFSFLIDTDPTRYVVVDLPNWIGLTPYSFRDGQLHTIHLKTEFIAIGTGIVDYFIDSAPFSLTIPTRSDLMPTAPSNIVVSYRRITNPFTRLQTGYEILATGNINVAGLKAAASIDGAADVDGVFNALSPTMTKITGITIPRDGLNHSVAIKFWVHDTVTNEDSTPLLIPAFPAVFDLEAPAVPTTVTATLLRNGSDAIPDQVLFAWDSPYPVDIYVLDSLQKKRKIYSADGSESSVVLENNRRYGTQDGTAQSYKFGCAAFNRSVQSEIVYAAPLTITAGSKEVAPQTPDEVAGTAEKFNQAQLVSALSTELTSVDSATISTVINALITKIKTVISLGGSVSLNDLGQFAAKWSEDKISSTGAIIPAARSGLFLESDGFTKGTKLGRVMSDTEAALLK